jgi:phosphate transport system substrate-binding protein
MSDSLKCPLCQYTNTSLAKECEICGTLLTPASLPNKSHDSKKKIRQAMPVVGKILLMLIGLTIVSIGASKIMVERASQGKIESSTIIKERHSVPKENLTYGGEMAFAALAREGLNKAINDIYQFNLRYSEPKFGNPGSNTGIAMLLDRELTVAHSSRQMTIEEIEKAKRLGFQVESVAVAIDGIVFYVNKSLGIKSMTLEQLRDIYQGRVKNWQELGGVDLPITPISLDNEVERLTGLLNISQIDNDVIIARDYTTAIRQTAATEGAISYGSSSIVRGQRSIRPIAVAEDDESPPISALLADGTVNLQAFSNNLYPLNRRLFVVIRRDGTILEKTGVAYINFLLSEEGQKIVRRAGFVPFR